MQNGGVILLGCADVCIMIFIEVIIFFLTFSFLCVLIQVDYSNEQQNFVEY